MYIHAALCSGAPCTRKAPNKVAKVNRSKQSKWGCTVSQPVGHGLPRAGAAGGGEGEGQFATLRWRWGRGGGVRSVLASAYYQTRAPDDNVTGCRFFFLYKEECLINGGNVIHLLSIFLALSWPLLLLSVLSSLRCGFNS